VGEPARDLEPPEAGHLNVQEDEVRLVPIDGAQGLESIRGLPDDLDVGHLLELVAQFLARERLIVNDEDAQRDHAVFCSSEMSCGTSMRALVPRPGSLV